MEKQNVTLALPRDLLLEARHLAVEKGTSLSALLAEYVRRMLRDDTDYRDAMTRARARMTTGYDLGTGGNLTCSREDLHER